ncbi:hypothetical protein AVEN_120581-1 [Araneus ventricosus]|uniref:Kynurenine formamidase n=1 Tax=Araneus ventricosus TaxID=182803 RepID=A0A4Y2H905_ARAVE|nr:hypothetical protein AVEN_120581-1 [Araneus ventricosus]
MASSIDFSHNLSTLQFKNFYSLILIRFEIDEYSSGTHVGTHIDAACHFANCRWCVDEIPLHRLMSHAAVIDITEKAEKDRDTLVEVQDLLKWEMISGHTLDGSIVMVRSGWGKRLPDRQANTGTADFDASKLHFPGVSKEAAQWLVDNRNIYGLGIDTLSVDNGISKDTMPHKILYDKNVYGLENVVNLEKIPLYGATIHAMPMKIGKVVVLLQESWRLFQDILSIMERNE